MRIFQSRTALFAVLAALTIVSCDNKKFEVNGTITEAKDSILYFENMSLNGPVVEDSVKLDADGAFDFSGKVGKSPEFYRLRIAGQIINLSIDSTEVVSFKAAYPTMSTNYEVKGSYNCSKIKELSIMQYNLQNELNSIQQSPNLSQQQVNDSCAQVLTAYKNNVKFNYIYKEPMKSYAYFALFQTVVFNNMSMLLFNPRNNAEDIKVYAAVATSWDQLYPKSDRCLNLHNIAIQGMRDVRILRNEQAQATMSAAKVSTTGIIDIALPDNKGVTRRLSDLKGKVVMLDFHVFGADGSTKRIMWLRNLYNKYHAQGFEIYQVSLDPNDHFWKTQTAALPWICVRDEDGVQGTTVGEYNVQSIPTFFLLGRDCNVDKRDIQIKDLDSEIKSLLAK